ncbi:MAG: DUF309 domain-containing protein [Candidatus Nitrosocosmicus sp.]
MHRRFMVYLDNKNKKFHSIDSRDVLKRLRSVFAKFSNVEIRDVRISSYFVEVDLSIFDLLNSIKEPNQLSNEILAAFLFVAPVFYWDYLTDPKSFVEKEIVLNNAIFLFNIERFWKSHEILEGIWKESSGEQKRILNGLILIDAAFVHYQKNELGIFVSIVERSLQKLRESSGMFYNLNLDEIKNNLYNIIFNKNFDTFKIVIY